MWDLLAQMGTAETVVTGVAGVTAGGLGLWVIQQVVKRGFKVSAEVGDGNGNGKAATKPASVCPLHSEFEKRLDERHAMYHASLNRIEAGQDKIGLSITKLHERIDTLRRK